MIKKVNNPPIHTTRLATVGAEVVARGFYTGVPLTGSGGVGSIHLKGDGLLQGEGLPFGMPTEIQWSVGSLAASTGVDSE